MSRVSIVILLSVVIISGIALLLNSNKTIEDTQRQTSESLTFCQQDSDCVLVSPLGNSVNYCCWGCLTFSVNKNQKEKYNELFSQGCKEIECPPFAPGAACPILKTVCIKNKCEIAIA